jgi:pyruvate kinase
MSLLTTFLFSHQSGPIIVITTSERVANQCYGVLKGCDARIVESVVELDVAVNQTISDLVKEGKANVGDPIVVVQGTNPIAGSTNTMRIQYA